MGESRLVTQCQYKLNSDYTYHYLSFATSSSFFPDVYTENATSIRNSAIAVTENMSVVVVSVGKLEHRSASIWATFSHPPFLL